MPRPWSPSIAGIELRTVPAGLGVLDALVKEAWVNVRFGGDIEPSHFLVLFDGDLGDVEAALARALQVAAADALETLLLPQAHAALRCALAGEFQSVDEALAHEWALGSLQCHSVLGTLASADRALKVAETSLLRLRLASELGGQGHVVLVGDQHDVDAALDAAVAGATVGVAIERRLVPRPAEATLRAAAQRQRAPRDLRPFEP